MYMYVSVCMLCASVIRLPSVCNALDIIIRVRIRIYTCTCRYYWGGLQLGSQGISVCLVIPILSLLQCIYFLSKFQIVSCTFSLLLVVTLVIGSVRYNYQNWKGQFTGFPAEP